MMNKELSKSKSKKPATTTTEDAASASASAAANKPKFLKRSEIEAQRQAAYHAEQRALEAERESKAAAKRKHEEDLAAEKAAREEKRRKLAEESKKQREDREWEEEQARRRRLGLKEKKREEEKEETDAADDIPEEELRQKLRDIGEPVAFFGEGHGARVRRYRKLTTVMTDGPIPTTLELVEEKDMRVDGKVPKDKEERKWLYRQLASYFTMVLAAYEQAMEAEKRDTTASKQAYATMVQTRENMKPVSPSH